jgi:hypothetical protein
LESLTTLGSSEVHFDRLMNGPLQKVVLSSTHA